MKWFKHFSDASKSLKVNELIDELGLEGYARWFLLLEFLNNELEQDDIEKNCSTFTVHSRDFSAKVHIKFRKKLETFLQKLADFSLLSYEFSGNFIKIDCPILLDLQSRDSKYNRVKRTSGAKVSSLEGDKNKKENKKENKNIYICADNIISFWNSKNLKPAEKNPNTLRLVKSGLDKQLKLNNRGTNHVEDAICNYSEVLHDDNCYYTYAFSVGSFIGSDKSERFYKENFSKKEYISTKTQMRTTAQTRQDKLLNMEFTENDFN